MSPKSPTDPPTGGPAPMPKRLVVRAHQPSYPSFVRGRAGDVLRVTARPETFPGWLWCTAGDGVASWVPEEFIDVVGDRATLRRDYDATELAMDVGDELEYLEHVADWVRCRTGDCVEGWVPQECLGEPSADRVVRPSR